MGARNCLVVQVTDEELDIHPHFPFNLLFLPEICGLEYRIPLNRIVATNIVKKFLFKKVELAFTTTEGSSEEVSLSVKRPEDFLSALRKDTKGD